MSNEFHKLTVSTPSKQGVYGQQSLRKVSNCKFGAKVLISKVGSGMTAQKLSDISSFRELLTDFRGQ